MRNLLLTLFSICITFSGMSQAQEHLTFKGIPITGTMESFCQQLKSKGFTQIGGDSNITLFTGNFTGNPTTISVYTTADEKNVFGIAVFSEPSGEWNTLTNTYDYYKDLYSRKYGKPKISKENNPSYDDSNISKIAEVYNGTVVWKSIWEVTGGAIEISIQKASGAYGGIVVILYSDSQNIEAKIQSDMEDI